MTLDNILSKYTIISVSVSKILSVIYDIPKSCYNSYYSRILHYKLGFTNKQLFQRYIDLCDYNYDNVILLIRGVPDRILPPYIDELKVTTKHRDKRIISIARDQLYLYMYLTGLNLGRIFIYYKDTNTLELKDIIKYDSNKLRAIIEKFIKRYSKCIDELSHQ